MLGTLFIGQEGVVDDMFYNCLLGHRAGMLVNIFERVGKKLVVEFLDTVGRFG